MSNKAENRKKAKTEVIEGKIEERVNDPSYFSSFDYDVSQVDQRGYRTVQETLQEFLDKGVKKVRVTIEALPESDKR